VTALARQRGPQQADVTGDGEWRQCEAYLNDVPMESEADIRENVEISHRCPHEARALVLVSCPAKHGFPMEVCPGHVSPPGSTWCAECSYAGAASHVLITFVKWI
jgi:hypothetical protein